MKFETQNPTKKIMLEHPEGMVRYEFYTREVKKSNIDNTIDHYEPIIKCCQKHTTGSTCYERRVFVEEGNEFYKMLLSRDFKRVTEETKSFA